MFMSNDGNKLRLVTFGPKEKWNTKFKTLYLISKEFRSTKAYKPEDYLKCNTIEIFASELWKPSAMQNVALKKAWQVGLFTKLGSESHEGR